jgi:hypothetical protein
MVFQVGQGGTIADTLQRKRSHQMLEQIGGIAIYDCLLKPTGFRPDQAVRTGQAADRVDQR